VPGTRPPYPAAFRAEAIQLARSSGKTIPELAKDLGGLGADPAHLGPPGRGGCRPRPARGADHRRTREELGRLRRETQTLRQERELLNKAAAFFAKETTR
jgi:transposase